MSEYLVRASALEGFAQTVTALGGDPTALLAAVGIPIDIKDPEAWISYAALLQLLELAAEETTCPHFGLELSRHAVSLLQEVPNAVEQQVVRCLLEYVAQASGNGVALISGGIARAERQIPLMGFEHHAPHRRRAA